MTKQLEALIASIKPDLAIASDKSRPQSESFPAIDRLSDVLTLDVLSELIAALEQSQQYAKERDAENQDLMLTVGRLRVELEASQLAVKLPAMVSFDEMDASSQDKEVIQTISECKGWNAAIAEAKRMNVAGGTVQGDE